jgi:hypothetical protein
MKKTIYKTVIQLEFLSEEPFDVNSDLENLIYEGYEGDLSMYRAPIMSNKPIKGKRAVAELEKHSSSFEFFEMDEEGNKIDDDE